MPIKARCLLCAEKEIELEVSSNVIAKSKEEAAQLLGTELIKHIMAAHSEKLGNTPTSKGVIITGEIPQLAAIFNGFLITRFFESDSEEFEEEKEETRDKLAEAIMWGSEDDDFEDEDEEPLLVEGEADAGEETPLEATEASFK